MASLMSDVDNSEGPERAVFRLKNSECSVEEVMQLMTTYRFNETVQLNCCQYLSGLEPDDIKQVTQKHIQRRNEFVKAGAASRIIEAVINHESSASVLSYGLLCIWHLARTDESRSEFLDLECIDLVMKAMDEHKESEEVQERACVALWNLFLNDVEVKEKYMSLGISDRILNSMRWYVNNSEIQDSGARLIGLLCIKSSTNRAALLTDEICQKLLQNLDDYADVASVIDSSIYSIGKLSFSNEGQEFFSKVNAITKILHAMDRNIHNRGIQIYGCEAIWMLILNHDRNKHKLVQLRGHETILRSMDIHIESAELQKKACGGMASLCNILPFSDRLELLESGVLERILFAMDRYPNFDLLQDNGCSAISSLTFPSREAVDLIWRLEAPERVLRALENHPHSISLQISGCDALKRLSGNTTRAVQILRRGGGKAMMAAMENHANNGFVLLKASQAIIVLCSHPEGLFTLFRLGAASFIAGVIDQPVNQRGLLQNYCQLMCLFARKDSLRLSLLNLDVERKMVKIAESNDGITGIYAARVVEYLNATE